ncbi:CTP synthase [Patescibacteria group bacterium]|nr:CTP synthase [Patescibacteria group bacterium]
MAKFIFITGGVLSGLGKGIIAASVGNILKGSGLNISIMKFDQYLNIDAGTLNPTEHGEVFVTADGAETDLDLGHYERFIDCNLSHESSVMSGQIFQTILENERRGEYLGKTIQMIPHVTDEVKKRIARLAKKSEADIIIVEIGGTIGDYEGAHFLEGIRQMRRDFGADNTLYLHAGFLPYLETTCELKTKPLQNSIRDLASYGIQPDIVFCRADYPISKKELDKISLFCGIDKDGVIPLQTSDQVYEVPSLLEKYNLSRVIARKLNLHLRKSSSEWQKLVARIKKPKKQKVKIALVGKYMAMRDTYISVIEALKSACWWNDVDLNLGWIDSEKIEKDGAEKYLKQYDGIVIPGGFGNRGIEGKIAAAKFARENKVPYLGLCLGMQIATIEFARYVLTTSDCNSEEFNPKTKNPVIHLMSEQSRIKDKGGTMRLGVYKCKLSPKSISYQAYGQRIIFERHRHRFEFNNKYRKILEKAGLRIVGVNPEKNLVEIIELKNHPFLVGSQFHPEFKSRPNRPHPLFRQFIKIAKKFNKPNNEPNRGRFSRKHGFSKNNIEMKSKLGTVLKI